MAEVLSDAPSDLESERGVSEGVSEDSGISDDMGATGYRRTAADRRVAKAVTSLAFRPASVCSMCDAEPSAYICPPCGRLTFCLKCCVSLHDNRFLNSHQIVRIVDDCECNVQQLQELVKKPSEPKLPKATKPPATKEPEEEELPRGSPDRVERVSGKPPTEEADLDLPSLAADQSIIQARLRELTHMSDNLRKLGIELTHEMDLTKETTTTAVEAVRRKFDILRNLINAKEQEFVAVVQEAGKARLDAATRGQIDANVIVSELHGYVAHSENQLDRLKGNRKLFNTSRRSMLDTSSQRLTEAEEAMHRLQDKLDAIRSLSMGMHIPLEESVEAIQRLRPPTQLVTRRLDPPHVSPISAKRFTDSPGVKVVTQSESRHPEKPALGPIAAAPTRQSFVKEVEALRHSPLPSKRDASPVRTQHAPNGAAPAGSVARAAEPQSLPAAHAADASAAAAPHGGTSALIARTAARKTSPNRVRSVFPPELEALRKQVSGNRTVHSPARNPNPTAAAINAPNGTNSPSVKLRAGTPTRRPGGMDSPLKQRGITATGNTSSRPNLQNHPGPGAYYFDQPFGSRAILSTPPRRR